MIHLTTRRERIKQVTNLNTFGIDYSDILANSDLVRLIEKQEGDGPVTVMVHGYAWNPEAQGEDNPHSGQFLPWVNWTGEPGIGFAWYSSPSVFDAWRSGHLHPYHCAWARAGKSAARALARVLRACCYAHRPVRLVAHSLGSRVVVQALKLLTPMQARNVVCVLLLNGAEYTANARQLMTLHPDLEVRNVVVQSDFVLRFLGALFAPGPLYARVIGLHGLEGDVPASWRNITLDDPAVVDWASKRGWSIMGDNPWKISDHWHSFRWPGNHPFLRAVLRENALPPT